MYLASYLRNQGFNIELIDCLAAKSRTRKYGTGSFPREAVDKPEILRHIPRKFARYGIGENDFNQRLDQVKTPDAILVTSIMTYWYPGPQRVVELVKQKFPDVPVILGGIYASLLPAHAKKVIKPDYIITGPGEQKALALLGEIFGMPESLPERPDDLDSYPYPALDLIRDHLDYLVVLTARGCPYNCSFCAQKLISMPFKQRNPDAVVEEIVHHYHKFKLRDLAFYDDALFINRDKHIKVILEKLIQKKLPLRLHSPNGLFANQIDPDLAELMYRANFKTVRLSFETSNENRRRDMSNKISNQGMIDAVNALIGAGFERRKLEAYVIMGLPDQGIDEILASAIFVNKLGLMIRLASFSPIPGTVDFDRAVQNGQIPQDIDPLLTNKTIFPLHGGLHSYEIFRKIRVFAQMLNNAALKNFSPFAEEPFLTGLQKVVGGQA